jgi:hypothetical protein
MAAARAGVEFHDVASGKFARSVSGPYDIIKNDPSSRKRPARAIVVTGGSATITGLDGVNVVLPDMGGGFWWDLQAIAIVSGTVLVIW